MASEASRKKALELSRGWGTALLCVDTIAAALDEARAEGAEEVHQAIIREESLDKHWRAAIQNAPGSDGSGGRMHFHLGSRCLPPMPWLDECIRAAEKRGAERERWECHRIASDFSERLGGTAGAVAIRIAARGPMRGPEE